jgi:hypothetical protein
MTDTSLADAPGAEVDETETPTVSANQQTVDSNGNVPYVIRVNGETVWTSGGDRVLVDRIEVNTPRGQATVVSVPPLEAALDIVVVPRALENLPLDVVDELKRRAAQEGNPLASLLSTKFGSTHPTTVVEGEPTPDTESAAEADNFSI